MGAYHIDRPTVTPRQRYYLGNRANPPSSPSEVQHIRTTDI